MKWKLTRKWEPSKVEVKFEELLKDNGFILVGIKEYSSLTDYLIEKDSIQTTFRINHTDKITGKKCYENFLRSYQISKDHEETKKIFAQAVKGDLK